MGEWLASHLDVLIMAIGGGASCVALLWRGASDTQRIVGRLDMVCHRLVEVERSAMIASDSRGKLHKRIDGVAADVENKIQHVRERVVVLETKATT